jgi:broad specificity phosphatase PhoE
MKLYIFRHGESENNRKGLWTGWMDVALTETGVQQATRLRPYFEGLKPDKFYSSDLQRALKTGQAVFPNATFETLPILREVNVGSLQGTDFVINDAETSKKIFESGYTAWGGESIEDFTLRAKRFLGDLETLDAQTVVAFSHGGFLRKLLDLTMGQKHSRQAVLCKNCALGVFEYQNGAWKLHSWVNFDDEA